MSTEYSMESRERQIIQSYVWALLAPQDDYGRRVSVIERSGSYHVRLIDVPDVTECLFWIELYDARRNVVLDSYGGYDIQDAAAAVKQFVLRANELDSSINQAGVSLGDQGHPIL